MARQLRIEYKGAFYHITSRGNERKQIFKGDSDRKKLLSYFESAAERYRAVIHVYCLMGNHYHLLLETPVGNLSQIMRHINGAYTVYFNKKYQRSGHLFGGRYKAIVVDKDEYAVELSRYIHVNPVRAGIASDPGSYKWSSYRYYSGKGTKPRWLFTDFILGYFGRDIGNAQKRYTQFVHESIGYAYENPLRRVVASIILGGNDFVEMIKDKYLKNKKVERDVPALRELASGPSIKEVAVKAKEVFGSKPELEKKATLYICHRYTGLKLKDIGKYFGIGESAVSQSSRRFQDELNKDRTLRRKIDQVKRNLGL
ncbi:MAG: transposase [bacterium]